MPGQGQDVCVCVCVCARACVCVWESLWSAWKFIIPWVWRIGRGGPRNLRTSENWNAKVRFWGWRLLCSLQGFWHLAHQTSACITLMSLLFDIRVIQRSAKGKKRQKVSIYLDTFRHFLAHGKKKVKKVSGKSKALVFFRVWPFNTHAPTILSADDWGDFYGVL